MACRENWTRRRRWTARATSASGGPSILPQSWAIFAALAILHFVWFWNDFLGPLIYVNSDASTPLSTGIVKFAGGNNHQQWNLMMVGALAMVVPVVIVVLLGQRYFKRGITVTGFGGR